jgi:hypothetical protein
MKSKNLLLLIIQIKNIHDFNVSRFILWIFSTERKILHLQTLVGFLGLSHQFELLEGNIYDQDEPPNE